MEKDRCKEVNKSTVYLYAGCCSVVVLLLLLLLLLLSEMLLLRLPTPVCCPAGRKF